MSGKGERRSRSIEAASNAPSRWVKLVNKLLRRDVEYLLNYSMYSISCFLVK
jgi:hypothetical protein